jgi:hypothetical protein
MFGLRTLGKYLVLLLLSLMFLAMISGQVWLQVLLNVAFVAGFALLTFNDAGALGERAETLRVTLEKRYAEGGKRDPESEAKAYRPAVAVTGLWVAALPLLIIALLNLASLPQNPQSLDPKNFQALETPAPEATLLPGESVLPEATVAAEATIAPEATVAPEAATAEPEVPANLFNTAARLAFSPFISLYALLSGNLLLLYILMVPLSFLLPAFALAGYLRGPKLRAQKLEAIKKGIRAKKRKEKRERKPQGPKPEV